MKMARAFAPIVKTEKLDDGTLLVYGKATGPDLDSDLQICDPAWLAKAMPEWMQWGNVREMHTPKAAGVGVALDREGDDWMLTSLVVDPDSVDKVDKKVLKGYSIGISRPVIVKDVAAPGGRIVGGSIVEVSLVDRPANPTCALTLAKAAAGAELTKVDDPMLGDGYEVELELEADEEEGEGDGAPASVDPIALLDQAKGCLAQVLASCASELAADPEKGGKVYLLSRIASMLSELDWTRDDIAYYRTVEALEDMYKAIHPTPEPQEATVHLSDLAALVKAASAPDAAEADTIALDELRKALAIDTPPPPADDVVTKAAKATEETQRLVAEVAEVKAELAKVLEIVPSTGPVRIRPTADHVKAAAYESMIAQADRLDHTARTVNDPTLADGYRALAAQKRAEADALKSA